MMIITGLKGGWEEVEEGKRGINIDGRRLDFGCEHSTVHR